VKPGYCLLVVAEWTDSQTNDELGSSVAREYQVAARQAGRPFRPVYVHCDAEENIRRVASDQRVNGGTGKLTDCAILRDIREKCVLFEFEDEEGLHVDTTRKEPQAVAREMLAFIEGKTGQVRS
jgi:hypothetical protein